VVLRCRGKRDTLARRASHEVLLHDDTGQDPSSWFETFGGGVVDEDIAGRLDDQEFLRRMREHLATVPRRSPKDSCDLVALFDELVYEVRETGEISPAAVGERFGIGGTTVIAWVSRLRGILGTAGRELPAPESHVVGGVKLSPADIRSAIEILRSAKGIMVKQPLARAGHPLSQATAGWYHQFSREEIALYPEIAIDPQTHRKPAGHVKIAVLHRLERMLGLGEAAAPALEDAEPELTPRDLYEAKLWAAGLRDPGVLEEILAMREELEQHRSAVSAA